MGLSNIRCIKRQKNKAGKGPRRAGWGGDLQEAAPIRRCLACRGIHPCLPGAGVIQAGCWSGSCRGALGTPLRGVFQRGGVLLAWKGIAAYSIVQMLSMHPKVFFPMRSSCLFFWGQSGNQPLRAGISAW